MAPRPARRLVPPAFDWWKWCEQERFDRYMVQMEDATLFLASGPLYAALRIRHGNAVYAATLSLFIGDGAAGWTWRLWTHGLATDVSGGGSTEVRDDEEAQDVRDRAASQLAQALLRTLRGA